MILLEKQKASLVEKRCERNATKLFFKKVGGRRAHHKQAKFPIRYVCDLHFDFCQLYCLESTANLAWVDNLISPVLLQEWF